MIDNNTVLEYKMRVCTNAEYSKIFRSQRPFVGTVVHAPEGSIEVKVLKDNGNTISIPRKCLTPYNPIKK